MIWLIVIFLTIALMFLIVQSIKQRQFGIIISVVGALIYLISKSRVALYNTLIANMQFIEPLTVGSYERALEIIYFLMKFGIVLIAVVIILTIEKFFLKKIIRNKKKTR